MFQKIAYLIESDGSKLNEISFKDKRDYLGFFVEIIIMMNTGLSNKNIAVYMFGYYAKRCWDNKYFWNDVNRHSIYWSAFRSFVELVNNTEENIQYNKKDFSL